MTSTLPAACEVCPVHNAENLIKLGVDMESWDFVVALAGNPNTGKSTVFNALTGLRQHTGNWPGKTVARAEGGYSFGGNRFILDRYELADQVQAYNEAAAKVSRRCADETGRPILVCGSMGPTGQLLKPLGKLTVEEAEEAYAEQAAALASGGVDYFWVETMSSLDEMAAAMTGAASTRLPFAATMSFDSKGRTMMGTTPEAALEAAKTFDPAPVAFGANCGSNPKQLVEVILKIVQSVSSNDIVIAKGNCGTPRLGAEGISYDGTPEIMADYACLVRDAGAHIIGGCCGTSADHLRAIGETLAARPRGQIPDQAKLVELLGEE